MRFSGRSIFPILHLKGRRAERWLWLAVLWFLVPAGISAERPSNWRIFRAGDGLRDSHATAVTLSPRGNVWVKHGDVDEISVLDGYGVSTFPSPGTNSYRVYESQSRQLWSLYDEGVMLYDGKKWIAHPIPEIRAEIQDDPLRRVRQIPLVPGSRFNVYFLLSRRLMQFNSSTETVTLIKHVDSTGLGRFNEMVEARDGGLWITGTRGLGKLDGPIRNLSGDKAWHEDLISERLQVENLQRPFESDAGRLVMAASDTQVADRRVVLQFDGAQWSKRYAATENVRQAWPGWDRTLWAYNTFNTLLRFEDSPEAPPTRERISVEKYKDVAFEANGDFWLATTEGLIRYAPFAWRTPREMEGVNSLVHAMLEDAVGNLWFASTEGLVALRGNKSTLIRWPEGFEADFQTTDQLFQLPDGRIAIGAQNRPLIYNPETGAFTPVVHPSGRRVKLIGQGKSGKLSVQTSKGEFTEAGAYFLEQFNGESFTPVIESQPDWNLGGELFFLHVAQNDDVWVGGTRGLALVRNEQLQVFGLAQGFVEDKAFCVLELGNGKIWCGGDDKILEFNGRTWAVIRSGLDRIHRMLLANDGKIWIATSSVLYCYSDGVWMSHAEEEGLPTGFISEILQDRRGRIWVGTTRGISLYHPEADLNPPKPLQPVLENSGRPMSDAPVTLLFNGVDKWNYTPPHRLLFSYRVDEGPWSPYTNAVSKSFNNLGSGKHRFEVRAMDRNWNESVSTAALEFALAIPWYRESRLMFVLVTGLVLVLFFAGLAVNRNRQLIRSYAEVEKIVAQRTKELERSNEELLHSQKMRALGTLAAGIAHDFNNILSIIKGSAQIIEGNMEDKERIRTRLSRIRTVVDQGAGIVKSMLGLSRVSEKDFILYDLNSVVEDTIKVLGDRFLQEVTIGFEAAPSLPSVVGVKELTQQMLLNLILNSADAMAGQGEIVIKTGQLINLPGDLALPPAIAASYVYVAVRDSGCGISPEVLPRIFEPFFTTKAFSTRRGTGLGLSMVYELAKEMGYGLKVRSKLDKGSTFTILVPINKLMMS
jgi:signal transduction histidine kinase